MAAVDDCSDASVRWSQRDQRRQSIGPKPDCSIDLTLSNAVTAAVCCRLSLTSDRLSLDSNKSPFYRIVRLHSTSNCSYDCSIRVAQLCCVVAWFVAPLAPLSFLDIFPACDTSFCVALTSLRHSIDRATKRRSPSAVDRSFWGGHRVMLRLPSTHFWQRYRDRHRYANWYCHSMNSVMLSFLWRWHRDRPSPCHSLECAMSKFLDVAMENFDFRPKTEDKRKRWKFSSKWSMSNRCSDSRLMTHHIVALLGVQFGWFFAQPATIRATDDCSVSKLAFVEVPAAEASPASSFLPFQLLVRCSPVKESSKVKQFLTWSMLNV